MSITRTAMIDDDGSGTTGTIFNNAWKQELYNQIDGALLGGAGITANIVTVTTGSGSIHNLPCGPASLVTILNLVFPSGLPVTLTGLSFSTASRDGDIVHMINHTSNGVVYLAFGSGSSAHPFNNIVLSGPTPLGGGGSGHATYIYNGGNGQWYLQTHEQGAWITPPFSAGNFSASGSMTWTVEAGDYAMCRYRLSGRTLQLAYSINTTSIGGTVGAELRINNGAWGGFSATGQTFVGFQMVHDGSGFNQSGFNQIGLVNGGYTWITLYKPGASAWVAGTNNAYAMGQITFEVT